MINLDWRSLGQQYALTFAWVRIVDGQARCELRQWGRRAQSPTGLFVRNSI